MSNKCYLGDAVYVEFDELRRLVLTTEDGVCATNTIVLETEVYEALLGYVDMIKNGNHIGSDSTGQALES